MRLNGSYYAGLRWYSFVNRFLKKYFLLCKEEKKQDTCTAFKFKKAVELHLWYNMLSMFCVMEEKFE